MRYARERDTEKLQHTYHGKVKLNRVLCVALSKVIVLRILRVGQEGAGKGQHSLSRAAESIQGLVCTRKVLLLHAFHLSVVDHCGTAGQHALRRALHK